MKSLACAYAPLPCAPPVSHAGSRTHPPTRPPAHARATTSPPHRHISQDKVTNNFFTHDLADETTLVSQMLLSVRDAPSNPGFVSLKERLLPILRDVLMYQHNELVSTALALIFRLIMMRAETASLLQEVQLLHSPEMVDTYCQACMHAVRLQSVFNNKTNLRGQWCDAMLHELQWFMDKVPGRTPAPNPKSPSLYEHPTATPYHFLSTQQQRCIILRAPTGSTCCFLLVSTITPHLLLLRRPPLWQRRACHIVQIDLLCAGCNKANFLVH